MLWNVSTFVFADNLQIKRERKMESADGFETVDTRQPQLHGGHGNAGVFVKQELLHHDIDNGADFDNSLAESSMSGAMNIQDPNLAGTSFGVGAPMQALPDQSFGDPSGSAQQPMVG